MKAVRIHNHGSVDELCYEDIEKPEPRAGQVQVQVKACAMNHLDIWVRQGLPGVKIPLPLILGSDISGVITAVGNDVSAYKTGDEVVVSPGTSCGICPACLSGEDHLCLKYGIVGETENGGYCEFICLPTRNILPKPTNLNFPQAAAIPLVNLTAWHMLVTKGRIAPGQWVLIHAAGSGIGTAAIQIAKLFQTTVIATAGSDEKLQKAAALGADHLINYETENFQERVKALTEKRGVDVVFEHVGQKTFAGSYLSLRRGGRLITCGSTTGPEVKMDLRYIFSRNLEIIGTTMGSKGEMAEIMKHVQAGRLKPVVDREFPLREVKSAHAYLNDRKQFGKVILIP